MFSALGNRELPSLLSLQPQDNIMSHPSENITLHTSKTCPHPYDCFPPGFVKPPPSSTHAEKYSGLDPGLKHWLLNTRAATMDGTTRISDKTTTRTMTAGSRAARGRSNLATAGPDKRAQMLKMISALEELQRTYNSTLSSRITIIPRGKHPGNVSGSLSPQVRGEWA